MQEAEANSTALANAQEELRQQAADMADQLAAVRSHSTALRWLDACSHAGFERMRCIRAVKRRQAI